MQRAERYTLFYDKNGSECGWRLHSFAEGDTLPYSRQMVSYDEQGRQSVVGGGVGECHDPEQVVENQRFRGSRRDERQWADVACVWLESDAVGDCSGHQADGAAGV